jgi:hypothetical protein
MKLEMDMRIVGFSMVQKATRMVCNFSITTRKWCGLLKTAPGGMTEAMMADITNRQEELMGELYRLDICGL